MPRGDQDHCRVPASASVAFCGFDWSSNIGLGQVLSAAKFTVRLALQGDCTCERH
jgi:hypothetical protein